MKIALVHDYLNEAGGAERVLRVLADMYPSAPIYTSFAKNGSARRLFKDRTVRQSPWGGFLRIGRAYSWFRFLLPWIWESLDLRAYDVVITSCSGYVARGFRVGPKTQVVAYCHTPPKWLYGYETPTGGRNTVWGKVYLWIFGPFVRYFDFKSAQRVDVWIANSQEVAARIRKFYRKDARVVYPPVDTAGWKPTDVHSGQGGYYLTVARVVGAKGLVAAARAAKEKQRKLVVAGELVGGRGVASAIRRAGGTWVTLAGRVSDDELADYYRHAMGYIALARDEDFGMTVVEAMSYGVPVLALKSGGFKETVIPHKSGVLVDSDSVTAVKNGMKVLESSRWDATTIRDWAEKFGRRNFEKGFRSAVQEILP